MRKSLQDILALLACHREALQKQFGVRRLGLFGSRVRDDFREDSDIDILVVFEQSPGWEIVDLKTYLEDLLGEPVDLVTENAVRRRPLLWDSIQQELVYV